MHFDEVLSNLIPDNSSIVYIGQPSSPLAERTITNIDVDHLDEDVSNKIPKNIDYLVIAEALEISEDPEKVIRLIRESAKNIVIYEFKHQEGTLPKPEYKLHWLAKGLEGLLCQEFDYVRSIYLGYATVYFCEGPNKQVDNPPITINAAY